MKSPIDGPPESVEIVLSQSEALVLFEFLSRFDESESWGIQDQAEERVLWDILAFLETKLVQPFRPDYEDLLRKARRDVRDPRSE